ncbi:CotH kinase family protein [Proteiniphilum sp.]|uniref:CotH kinase family protein n=1 Tax=Proteiniphilum sp. TaxID=1926877 RepID=UPI002B2190A1|nr:CotH kinase family protein [Proteiniphilum sp.]MEA4917813.1 CotH kinase family protein [Proteiniphilum sp.]
MSNLHNKTKIEVQQYRILFSLTILLGFIFVFSSCEKEDPPVEKIFVDIEITKLPDRTTFLLGEDPDFTGIEVSEVYTDGTKKPITGFKINWSADNLKRGTTKATVTARGRSAIFNFSFDGDLVDTGLPAVYIETEEHKPVDSKENYVKATMVIKEKGKKVSEHSLRIKGRGNATWTYEKKPYKLKLDEKAGILGMKEDKDWVLLANYCDKTLLRSAIAFRLSRLMNFPYTVEDRFVDVFLNGDYMGNYQLVEGIKQGSNRVDIPKKGYIFEKDGYYLQEPNYFVTSMGYGYSFKNPDPEEDLTTQQWEYIKEYMNEFEDVLNSSTFNDPMNGYARYIDVPSFVRWFIFQNILANMDTNVYLTKDDMGDSKVKMGPVWDFEWSIGIGWYEGARPRPANYYVWNSNGFYYDRLLQDPQFKAKVKQMWQTINITDDILRYIDETAAMLEKSQQLNFRRWDIMNIRVSVGGIPMGSYEKEVECDRTFFINHMNWLNNEISNF